MHIERSNLQENGERKIVELVVVLDNIRSGNNVGSFFRTCDALGVKKLVLCGISATPPEREVHKTALGAELIVAWEYFKDTTEAVARLQSEGYKIYAVEQVHGAIRLPDFQVQRGTKYALVFGNEVEGVSQEIVSLCNGAIEIPQVGAKHSLNVAVAGGIALWGIVNSEF